METQYTIIINRYDPVTDADLLQTRQEIPVVSLSRARTIQQEELDKLKGTGHYRSYIQERDYYTVKTGKKREPEKLTFSIRSVTDLMEI